jgi:ATP-binding cassette, subfamily B, bacterial MsbA
VKYRERQSNYYQEPNLYKRLFSLLLPHWGKVAISFFFAITNVLFNSITVWISATFVTSIFSPDIAQETQALSVTNNLDLNTRLKIWTYQLVDSADTVSIFQIAVMIIVIAYFGKSVSYYLNSVFTGLAQQKVAEDLRNRLYSHFLIQPLSFFQSRRSGDLISLTMNDVSRINNSLGSSFRSLMIEPLTIIALYSLLFIINWKLTLISTAVIPFTAFIIDRISQSMRRKVKRSQEQLGEITSQLSESISGIKIIKAFTNETFERGKFFQFTDYYFKLMFRQIQLQSASLPITEMLGVLMGASLLWIGGMQVLEYGTSSSEDFLRFIILLFTIYQPIRNLANVNVSLQGGIAASSRIFEMLDIEAPAGHDAKLEDIMELKDSIQFKDVSFHYDTSDYSALLNINLEIKRGEVVALVGASGAGKTTLADLLPRYYDVESGGIYLDGQNINTLSRKSLRNLMGIVSQDTFLFNTTIFENIAYGLDVDKDDVYHAAKLAHAHDFICEFELGYDTIIGERGTRLSGGQKQRVAIARALLRNPQILILDEATSALDTESERLVQSAIDHLMENRTALVIAHRLSTILNADKIVVMENGQIIQQGSHDALIKEGGVYKKLYDLQFKSE